MPFATSVLLLDNASIHHIQGIVDFSEDQTQLSCHGLALTGLSVLWLHGLMFSIMCIHFGDNKSTRNNP